MYRQMQEKTAAKSADGREAALQSNKRAFYVLKILKKPHSAEYLIFCESRGANAANLTSCCKQPKQPSKTVGDPGRPNCLYFGKIAEA